MAKDGGISKCDANTEAFQMRAQWKKTDLCRKQWHERWSWLIDERLKSIKESDKIRRQHTDALPKLAAKFETTKTLKPVPLTTTGFVGWIASKPECKLEIYTSWRSKIPLRAPNAWETEDYVGFDN